MARTTGPILAIGAVTVGRDVLIDQKAPDWRVVGGTGIAAALFALGEKTPLSAFFVGTAWVALAVVTLSRVDPARPSPAEAVLKVWNR